MQGLENSPVIYKYRYLVIIWYIGSNFAGSQRQPNQRTVEGCLIKALQKTKYISDAQTNYFRAGMRTDKGVHAREAAYAFSSDKSLIPRLLDSALPDDMGLVKHAVVSQDFHPRWGCINKEYHYFLPLSKSEKTRINLEIIKKALNFITGTHDFIHFSKTDRTKPHQKTTITLDCCSAVEISDGLIFTFKAQAFLWEQIRRTVSFLYRLGMGKNDWKDLIRLLNTPSDPVNNHRIHREKPLPADGLTLWQVEFPKEIEFQENEVELEQKTKFLGKKALMYKQRHFWLTEFQKSV